MNMLNINLGLGSMKTAAEVVEGLINSGLLIGLPDGDIATLVKAVVKMPKVKDRSIVEWLKLAETTDKREIGIRDYLFSPMTYANLTFASNGKVAHIYHNKIDGYAENSMIGGTVVKLLSDAGAAVVSGKGAWSYTTRLSDGKLVVNLELGGDTATISYKQWVESCNGQEPRFIVSVDQFGLTVLAMMFQDRTVLLQQ